MQSCMRLLAVDCEGNEQGLGITQGSILYGVALPLPKTTCPSFKALCPHSCCRVPIIERSGGKKDEVGLNRHAKDIL